MYSNYFHFYTGVVKDHNQDKPEFIKTFRAAVSDFLLGHGDRGGKRKARKPHQQERDNDVQVQEEGDTDM